MNVPDAIDKAVRPVFDVLPMSKSLRELVVTAPISQELSDTVARVLDDPALQGRPELAAGLWLYADELDKSHDISQGIPSTTGSFWHGIMHRREGDFSNSHYWFRKVGDHPAFEKITLSGGPGGSGTDIGKYDPHEWIDRIEQAHQKGQTPPDLVALQRHEWLNLFCWCARQAVAV